MSTATEDPTPLSYKDAGVDIAAADRFVGRISKLAGATHTPGVVWHASRYAALFRPDLGAMEDPLIAATCDGVGTKLLVAKDVGIFEGIGRDLVAMNVNDLLPLGARPLLFLDYLATGKLDEGQLEAVVTGISQACREAGCALLGGETAEMPGLYKKGDFDIAGFAVGMVDGARLPDASAMKAGDVVLALPSTGIHSNGLSLARKALFDRADLPLNRPVEGLDRPLASELLEPTALYVKPVLAMLEVATVKAMAHVTGGGLIGRGEKLPAAGLRLRLDPTTWTRPPVFDLIAKHGNIEEEELGRTFNLGLGYLAAMDRDQADAVLRAFPGTWLEVGSLVEGDRGVEFA